MPIARAASSVARKGPPLLSASSGPIVPRCPDRGAHGSPQLPTVLRSGGFEQGQLPRLRTKFQHHPRPPLAPPLAVQANLPVQCSMDKVVGLAG